MIRCPRDPDSGSIPWALLAEPTVQVGNERIRVAERRVPPGAATGHHRHAHDDVSVATTTARPLPRDAAGERHAELQAAKIAAKIRARREGIAYDVVDADDRAFPFVEIEPESW